MSVLFVSVAISFMNATLPKILKKIPPCLVKKNNSSSYKEEKEEILTELKNISIRHDFPKYARLQRKLNKLVDDKKAEDTVYQNTLEQIMLKMTYISQGLMTLVSLGMFWMYRFHPVAQLPQEWLYPFENVFSWPIQSAGVISFPVWFLICNSVSKFVTGCLGD